METKSLERTYEFQSFNGRAWPQIVCGDDLIARLYGPHGEENGRIMALSRQLLDFAEAAEGIFQSIADGNTRPDMETSESFANWARKLIEQAKGI